MNENISNNFNKLKLFFEKELGLFVESLDSTDPVHLAARYALDGAGKRIRPVLALGVAEALGTTPQRAMSLCLALELIHNASLVHDDLPALDNDDFRRGRPACHKKFSESIALLAGDWLFLKAFDCVSADQTLSPEVRTDLVKLLSEACLGLCEGQGIDIGLIQSENPKIDLATLERCHAKKTGLLFRAACIGPVLLLEADRQSTLGLNRNETLAMMSGFGSDLGMLFQIVDDIEDYSGDDYSGEGAADRSSYVNVLGIEGAKAACEKTLLAALRRLEPLADRAEFLKLLAQSVADHALSK